MHFKKIVGCIAVAVTLIACSSGGGSNTSNNNNNNQFLGSGNVVPLIVDSGYNNKALNRPFITITVCQPNTNNCQIIDHVLVDTGSTGLRINLSTLQLQLPSISYQGNPLYQCMRYAAGFNFGPVVSADLKVAGEVASSIPVQIFNDINPNLAPDQCSQGYNLANLNDMGAKAIIGVNPYSNPNNNYTTGGVFTCNSASTNCTQVGDPTAIPQKLNINPVIAFAQDNNGLILNLPSVSQATSAPLFGNITFGLNTESNNQVSGNVTTVAGNPAESFPVGFFDAQSDPSATSIAIFDSGTPTLAFYNSTFQQCTTSELSGFYCPAPSPANWNSTIFGYQATSSIALTASIINYAAEPNSFPNSILPGFGEFYPAANNLTIYGLPFFYGKQIYLGLMGETGNSTPLGTGPAWGFTSN